MTLMASSTCYLFNTDSPDVIQILWTNLLEDLSNFLEDFDEVFLVNFVHSKRRSIKEKLYNLTLIGFIYKYLEFNVSQE